MTFNHAVIWIDHSEAHVIHFDAEASESEVVKTRSSHPHLHHKSGSTGAGHSRAAEEYLRAVAEAAADASEILVVGPGSAKLELIRYVEKQLPKVAEKILGVETVDHPTDRQLVAHARRTFVRIDQLNGTAALPT
jgi:stalled ribosome rescue protein Dom34